MGYAKENAQVDKIENPILNQLPSGANLITYEQNPATIDISPADISIGSYYDMDVMQRSYKLEYEQKNEEIYFRWQANKDEQADCYKLYQSQDGSAFEPVTTVKTNSTSIQLPTDGIYHYYILAFKNNEQYYTRSNLVELPINKELPIDYTRLCEKSTPKLSISKEGNLVDLSWEIIPTGIYDKDGEPFAMNYNYTMIFMQQDDGKYQKVAEVEGTEYSLSLNSYATYNFFVASVYNNSMLTPSSNIIKYTNAPNQEYARVMELYGKDKKKETSNPKKMVTLLTRERDISSIEFAYCLIEGGEGSIVSNEITEIYWNVGNIDVDPMFNDGFSLTESSPCIDAGNPAIIDIDNTPSDIGGLYFIQDLIVINSISPEPGEFVISPDEFQLFQVNAEDSNGLPLEYIWSLDETEVSDQVNFVFDADIYEIGQHELVLEISNNLPEPERSTLTYNWNIHIDNITVDILEPEMGNIELTWGDSQNFVVSATDANDFALEYTWSLDNEVVANDTIYTFTAPENIDATYNLQLEITNNQSRGVLKTSKQIRATEVYEWNIIVSATSADEDIIFNDTRLFGNSPNPFYLGGADRNGNTTIDYHLKQDCQVEVTIFNTKGQRVITLVEEAQARGLQQAIWNGKDSSNRAVGSGVYFYTLKAGEQQFSKKMLVVK